MIERYVDISNLKRCKTGKVIHWANTIGSVVPFKYGDYSGEILITDYTPHNKRIYIEYGDKSLAVNVDNFKKGAIGKLFNDSSAYKYEIGEEVNNRIILNRIKMNNGKKAKQKGYIVKCVSDGYETNITETKLYAGYGCPVCSTPPRVCVKGINDIHTTDRWMCEYIINEEDWYTHTYGSWLKVDMVCPSCHTVKSRKINELYTYGLACECGGKVNYPNKFITSLFRQLNIDYDIEKIFEWSNNKRYDHYIPSLNCIIENHGRQHYVDSEIFTNGRSLREEQENDELKHKLALNNGVEHYVILDCRYSTYSHIKSSIMNSKLPMLINFKESDIDWRKCHSFAIKNRVKEVCDMWMTRRFKTSKEIAEYMGLSQNIVKYLKQGAEFGWCDYSAKEEMRKNGGRNGKNRSTKIEIIKDDVVIGEAVSATELERVSEDLFGIKLLQSGISKVCTGKAKQHKGFTFRYV